MKTLYPPLPIWMHVRVESKQITGCLYVYMYVLSHWAVVAPCSSYAVAAAVMPIL